MNNKKGTMVYLDYMDNDPPFKSIQSLRQRVWDLIRKIESK